MRSLSKIRRTILARWNHLLAGTGVILTVVAAWRLLVGDPTGAVQVVALALIAAGVAVNGARIRGIQRETRQAAKLLHNQSNRLNRGIVEAVGTHLRAETGTLAHQLGELRRDEDLRYAEWHLSAEDLREQLQAWERSLGETTASVKEFAINADRLRIDTTTEIHQMITQLSSDRDQQSKGVVAELGRQFENLVSELSALQNLYAVVGVSEPVPPMGLYAVTPRSLWLLTTELLDHRHDLIVECGSGTSTVWLALVCKMLGRGRVVALENDPAYAERTRHVLQSAGVADLAEVRDAPLTDQQHGDDQLLWFDSASYSDLSDIGLLLVDGPPKSTGENARYPAFPLLADRLAFGGTVMLDDTHRATERRIAERWAQEPTAGRVLVHESSEGRSTTLRIKAVAVEAR